MGTPELLPHIKKIQAQPEFPAQCDAEPASQGIECRECVQLWGLKRPGNVSLLMNIPIEDKCVQQICRPAAADGHDGWLRGEAAAAAGASAGPGRGGRLPWRRPAARLALLAPEAALLLRGRSVCGGGPAGGGRAVRPRGRNQCAVRRGCHGGRRLRGACVRRLPAAVRR